MYDAEHRSAETVRSLWWPTAGGLLAVLLAGCGSTVAPPSQSAHITTGMAIVAIDPSPASSNTPTAWLPGDFSVQRRTWGGLCAGTPDCAANRYGVSVAYEWTFAGRSGSASSCEHPISPNDSLVVEIERVVRSISS